MTYLHYAVCKVGHDWVLACEDRPVATFDNREQAMRAARICLAAADKRGDVAVLECRNELAFAA